MNKSEKTALVPKLRFPEFQNCGEWDSLELNELLVETKQRNRALKYDPQHVLSVSGEYGCVNQIEFMGRSYAGASVKDYHIVEKGDLVYTKSPLKKNPFGIIKENKGGTGIVSTLYAVYRVTDKGCSAYLDQYFSGDFNLNSYLQPLVRKGAKNDMKVNNYAVLCGKIVAPKLKEQQKIADFLSSADSLISAENKKLEALKSHKKGLLQKLFPAEGKVTPEIRLKGFTNTWERRKLGEIADISSGGTPSRDICSYWNGDIPWATTAEVNYSLILETAEHITASGLSNSSAKIMPVGTILMAMYGQGKTRGQVAILGIEAATNQANANIVINQGVNNAFVYYQLVKNYKSIRLSANEGGQANLSLGIVKDSSIAFTENIREQAAIGNLFLNLDELINSQSEKIEVLRLHKKGLMQGLFPSVEEVGE